MTKQNKILKKIAHNKDCGQSRPIKANNDECYTSIQNIIKELAYWGSLGKFKDKNIICPCDWDIIEDEEVYSITIKYNDTDIETTGNSVSKIEIQYDLWRDDNQEITINLKESEIEEFLCNKLTCNFIKTLTTNARKWGIKSITASGYNPETGRGIKFQDVDYSKYDICITNPPFSLYGEFMKAIVDKIDFIVLAPFLNRTHPKVGLNLQLGKAFLGKNVKFDTEFNNVINNKYLSVCVDWITSFREAQDERNEENKNYKTGIDYEIYKDEYDIMENMIMEDDTCPIKVPAKGVPDNYYGWFFTNIGFIHVYDLRQFEWYITDAAKYYNENPDKSPFKNKKYSKNAILYHNGKYNFEGIVARRIKPKQQEN